MLNWLTQYAAWQKALVSEWVGLVHQQQMQMFLQREILKTVIEYECIDPEFFDGEEARLDAVFVHYNQNTGEVFRQHVWFVAGPLGIEENLLTVAHHFGRWRFSV